MFEKAFKFTGKDLIKLSIMMIIATLVFGLPGLLIMLILQWITNQSYAFEAADKHGISQVGASRLGGIAIFVSSLAVCISGIYLELIDISRFSSESMILWLSVLCCMSIGLIDDLKSNILRPRVRLIYIFLIFSLCLGLEPTIVPQSLGIWGVDFILDNAILGWLITTIFCAGFVNAINMADGANGLMPGTLTIAFFVFYAEVGSMIYGIFFITCGLFMVFNVISGRLFLGDAGAYGLGSMLALNGLMLFSMDVFSPAFLAVLFAYPCIDILITVARRRISGRSIFLPDNDHLHNRVHFHFQNWFHSKTLANSITGLLIVSFSSGVALIGYVCEWWSVLSNQWAWVFTCQLIVYLFAFFVSGVSRPVSQYVTDR